MKATHVSHRTLWALMLLFRSGLHAAMGVTTWQGPANGDWFESANWSAIR